MSIKKGVNAVIDVDSLQELGQHFVNEWLLHDDKLPSDELIHLLEKAMPEELRPYLCCKV